MKLSLYVPYALNTLRHSPAQQESQKPLHSPTQATHSPQSFSVEGIHIEEISRLSSIGNHAAATPKDLIGHPHKLITPKTTILWLYVKTKQLHQRYHFFLSAPPPDISHP